MIRAKVVAGPVQIGAGEVVRLSETQFAPRAHNVDVIKRRRDEVDVRARGQLEFKTGEVVGLTELPKHFGDRVVDLDAAAGDGEGQAAS